MGIRRPRESQGISVSLFPPPLVGMGELGNQPMSAYRYRVSAVSRLPAGTRGVLSGKWRVQPATVSLRLELGLEDSEISAPTTHPHGETNSTKTFEPFYIASRSNSTG